MGPARDRDPPRSPRFHHRLEHCPARRLGVASPDWPAGIAEIMAAVWSRARPTSATVSLPEVTVIILSHLGHPRRGYVHLPLLDAHQVKARSFSGRAAVRSIGATAPAATSVTPHRATAGTGATSSLA